MQRPSLKGGLCCIGEVRVEGRGGRCVSRQRLCSSEKSISELAENLSVKRSKNNQ